MLFKFCVLAALAVLPAAVFAKQLPQYDFALNPPMPGASEYSRQGRFDATSGTPQALYGLSAVVLPGTPEQMAAQFLREQAAPLGLLDPGLADLEPVFTRSSKSGHNVQFEQRVAGVPVYAGRVVVHVSPANMVTQVTSGYRPDARLDSVQPLVSAAQARASALARLGASAPLAVDETTLTAYQGRRLAWRVRVSPAHPYGFFEALVDAATGEIIALWDRAAWASSTGSSFDPDPLSSAHGKYGAPIADNDDADSTEINAEVHVVDLGELDFAGGEYMLKSQWAEITDHEAPNLGYFTQASPDFIFTRSEQGFEASMTFWHIQESMRYINETLGITLRPYQYEGGVQFDPHGLDGEDNSHYNTGTGQLAFGEGCVDDNEDADVIWHELGHGVHDWVTNGGLSNMVDGLSEGFADYWAHSYSRSLGQLKPEDPEYHWVYSWDGHNECWAGRVTNYDLPWPAGMKPYPLIHESGQMISTCLMKVYDQIGREKTDAMALEGLAMTGEYSSQNDAANAMAQAAADMGYAAAELTQITDTFGACGYVVAPVFPLSAVVAGKLDSGRYGGALPLSLLLLLMGGGLLRRR